MLRQLVSKLVPTTVVAARKILQETSKTTNWPAPLFVKPSSVTNSEACRRFSSSIGQHFRPRCLLINPIEAGKHSLASSTVQMAKNNPGQSIMATRQFHAAGSKVHYMDFRYRLRTNHLRLDMIIIKRQKMKKHHRKKFRKKFKCLLAKERLKREIAKEKTFRVELLTMIRRAESFDPREYALASIAENNRKPKAITDEKRIENLKELIRINRFEVDYIKPKHRRAEDS